MRYAVYFTPSPDHPLWQAGCHWLGRDPAEEPPPNPAHPDRADPWRYGFHATLKPPMHLSAGNPESSFVGALQRLAARHPRFEMPAMAVRRLGDFVALRTRDPLLRDHPLRGLADACVIELDPWREPPTEAELQRRQAAGLDSVQRVLLQRYGYPHVLERWRFHMTLSNALPGDPAALDRIEREAAAHFARALAEPLACDALSLFVERTPGGPFRLIQRFPLG